MIDIQKIKSNVDSLSKTLDSLNIDSIMVEQDGSFEKIFYNEEKLHELRSCSKLLVAMAVGIAIDKKMEVNNKPLRLDTKIYPIIENITNITNKENLSKIKKWTLKDLLTHQTGYDTQMFNEKSLMNVEKEDVLNFALNYEIPHEVGQRYAYNNVEPFMISVLFSECFNTNLSDFINENIFKKLEIENYNWGNYGKYCMGATGLYLSHTDFHKIAQLLLNDGKYKDIQVVPSNWIKEMCILQVKTPNLYKPERVLPKIGGGYFTFISRDGYIFRDGSNGQYIIMNKEKKLLITIMSSERQMKNVTEILRGIV